MENGTDVEENHVPSKPEDKVVDEPMMMVSGEVHIKIDAATGTLHLVAPPNQLIALAILKAAEIHISMGMQDAMRRARVEAKPAIVRAGADALKNLRPS